MRNVIWLIAGNKGGVGKSVIAAAFLEWLIRQGETPYLCEGDDRTPDVAQQYCARCPTVRGDLHTKTGWEEIADWLVGREGCVVANLPDGMSERAIRYFEDFKSLANSLHFDVKVIFVMNTLSDGISLLKDVSTHFDTIPLKNLHWGKPSEFKDFNTLCQQQNNVIHFPSLNKTTMRMVRDSGLSFQEFIDQRSNSHTNILILKAIVATWLDDCGAAFNEVLAGDMQ